MESHAQDDETINLVCIESWSRLLLVVLTVVVSQPTYIAHGADRCLLVGLTRLVFFSPHSLLIAVKISFGKR